MSFPVFLALKYLKPKRSVASIVTIFTILGVILGVAIIIIVRAIMTGFGDMWHDKILAFKPHITVTAAYGNRTLENEAALCRQIENIPGVTAVSPAIETRVLAEFNQNILAPIVIGIDPVAATNMIPFANSMRAGEFDLEGDSIVVGSNLADNLGFNVGDKILVYSPMNVVHKDEIYFPEELLVTGIFNTGQNQFDSDFLFVSLPLARDLVGLETGVYSVYVKTQNPRDQNAFMRICDDLSRALGPFRRLNTWHEVDRELFTALAVEKNMMTLLLAFITIVAIFCVTVTLIVITVQKTNEIGLLKALGFSSGQICLTFVLYGWIQCVIGMILGVGAAFLVLNNLQNLINYLKHLGVDVFPQGIYGLDALPWRVIPSELLQVLLIVQVFCILFCTLFAWRAARLDPIAALRKE